MRPELLGAANGDPFPILHEATPVRMDLSHSGWSDIFFLGMDLPEMARVLNVSIDLAVRGSERAGAETSRGSLSARDRPPRDSPGQRRSGRTAEIEDLQELFDFGRDYLGLLKAAVIASGMVPPGPGGFGPAAGAICFAQLIGRDGLGIEIVSQVNNIPKGSRLAVSTNLLASLISVCMRATGQAGRSRES